MTKKVEEDVIEQLEKITKKRKKGVNPKTKGKRGETYFAEKLSQVTGLHFHRIYASGASVGQSNSNKLEILTQAQSEAQLGDIQSPEDLKYYFIWESKNYEELDFHNLININCSKQLISWLEELEYDLESALTRMKNNYRQVAGFLLVKITRRGSWIIGNIDYISKVFPDFQLNNNYLFFRHEPRENLKKFGFGSEYFMTDFETFIKNNNEVLFEIDWEKVKKINEAKEALEKIYRGEK
ncbi:MAG: hypothetical protein BWY04_01169 [candidate division CPR1 bacterium ADurb.Bin160]|uniref:Uncharacterized protein n=1 Tax=candidate division CPR1 bacterium ADurb.Bin160 TaxID=1852826 RepID=A0A1V5ZKV1_9BACT|nr:MAG: hypothetical protein BWY04_01169 [candidate division CPR1 bacterium ADurb.Bin160]